MDHLEHGNFLTSVGTMVALFDCLLIWCFYPGIVGKTHENPQIQFIGREIFQ